MPLSEDKVNMVLAEAGAAFKAKGNLDSFWQECAELHYPERADFTIEKDVGEDFASRLYSSEPILFRREFGNWIGAAIRPKGRAWAKYRARDERIQRVVAVREFLSKRDDTMRALLYDPKSNFVKSMSAADHDWVTFGNAVMTCEPRRDRKGLRFRTWHLKNCAWRENYDGEVDTMFRRFSITARVLAGRSQVGWEISQKVTDLLEKSPESPVRVLHVCMPALAFDPKDRRMTMDFVSLYIDETHRHCMSYKPQPRFPYAVSRWYTIDGSPYGFSPCTVASVPDARSIQTMTWSILEAGEKAVEPPMIGQAEVVMGGVNLAAGKITWLDSRYDERLGEGLRPLELGGAPQFGDALRQGISGNIHMAWYLNKLFLPTGGAQMTAEEISRRHEEFLRTTQPLIDPAESERNGVILDLATDTAIAADLWGGMDDMPKELRGRDVDITYDNPIEDARKQAKTYAYKEALGLIQMTKEFGDPSVVAGFDNKEAFREAIDGVAPPNWLLSEDEMAEKVEEAKEMQELDQGMAQLGAMAETQAKVAPQEVAA